MQGIRKAEGKRYEKYLLGQLYDNDKYKGSVDVLHQPGRVVHGLLPESPGPAPHLGKLGVKLLRLTCVYSIHTSSTPQHPSPPPVSVSSESSAS